MSKNGTRRPDAPPDALAEDEVQFQTNGTLRFRIGGVNHLLRRPTVGELRAYVRLWNEYEAARNVAAKTANEDPPEGAPDDWAPEPFDTELWERGWMDWWRTVFAGNDDDLKGLDRSGAGLPEQFEDCPQWLLHIDLVSETFTHWRTVPWVGGTSPTQQREAAQQLQVEKLGPALQAVSPLLAPALAALPNANATPNS
jgi:hypothetical protein